MRGWSDAARGVLERFKNAPQKKRRGEGDARGAEVANRAERALGVDAITFRLSCTTDIFE